ncbi:MAG: pitrilysin family protein [Alphaproteobacteria bacterium]
MTRRMSTLSNGIRIASIAMPEAHSVSLGIWIKAGARDERTSEVGIAHFLEHMAFKGTASRNAAAIAAEVEDAGGYVNAHTSREETAYYIKLLPEDIELAGDILCDILTASILPEDEIERERGVILQELGQAIDSPDDIVFENFNAACYGDHILGQSILGTTDSVSSFNRDELRAFMDRHYGTAQMLICAAGKLDHDQLVRMCEDRLSSVAKTILHARSAPEWKGQTKFVDRELEQCHVVFGLPAPSATSVDRFALLVLSNIYGGGMSSRLFQQVREERGLCYSIFSFAQLMSDTGVFGIYAGTSEDSLNEMLEVSARAFGDVASSVSEVEMARARTQLKASVMMGLDSSSALNEHLARQILMFGEVPQTDNIIAAIEAVTADEVRRLAEKLISSATPSLSLVGPAGHALTTNQLSSFMMRG